MNRIKNSVNKISLGVLLVICLVGGISAFAIQASCVQLHSVSQENDVSNVNQKLTGGISLSTNYHQIFYGEWRIVDYIPGGRFSEPDEAKKYIGSVLGFYEEKLLVDGMPVKVLDDGILVPVRPLYECVLVATEDSHRFWGYFYPNEADMVINLESPYFAYITFDNILDIHGHRDNDILDYMNGFYVKDSETLIFDGGFGLLKMERVSFVEGYENFVGGV